MTEAATTQEEEEQQQLFEFSSPVHIVKTSLTFAGDNIVFDDPTAEQGDVVRYKGTARWKSTKLTDEKGVVTQRRILVSDDVTILSS